MKVKYKIKQGEFFKVNILNNSELEDKYGVEVWTFYDDMKEKNGILFLRIEGAGDQLDGWANHYYYLAIRKKDAELLGTLHIERGWHGTFVDKYILGYEGYIRGFREWKKIILDKWGETNE